MHFRFFLSIKLMHYAKLPLKKRPFWNIVRNHFRGVSILELHLLNSVCLSGSSHLQAFPEIVTKSGNPTLSTRLVRPFFFPASTCMLVYFEREKRKQQ